MSALDPNRKEFLDYLRTGFGHGRDFSGGAGSFTHQQVSEALRQFSRTDPVSWAILHTWMTTRLDLRGMAGKHSWPDHTIRRRLQGSADAVLCTLRSEPFSPVDGDYSVMSGCEVFHEALLHALEPHHPGIHKRIRDAMEMAPKAKRRAQRG